MRPPTESEQTVGIIERSLVCKWLWHIEGLRIEPPKLAVRGLLGDDQLDVLLQAICRVTGAAHRGSPGGRGGSEHSSGLSFEVLSRTCQRAERGGGPGPTGCPDRVADEVGVPRDRGP